MKRILLLFIMAALCPTNAAIRALQVQGNVHALTRNSDPQKVTLTSTFTAPVTFESGPSAFLDVEVFTNRIRIAPNSTVTFDRASASAGVFDINIDLVKGTVLCMTRRMEAASKFDVMMPIGACGVRGTTVEISDDGTIAVQEGTVLVVYVVHGAPKPAQRVTDKQALQPTLDEPIPIPANELTLLVARANSLRATTPPPNHSRVLGPPAVSTSFIKILRVTGDASASEQKGGFGRVILSKDSFPLPATIKTERGATADVELETGSLLRIHPDSIVTIDATNKVEVSRGKLLFNTGKDLKRAIVAPGSIIAARAPSIFEVDRDGTASCLSGDIKISYNKEGAIETVFLRSKETASRREAKRSLDETSVQALTSEIQSMNMVQ